MVSQRSARSRTEDARVWVMGDRRDRGFEDAGLGVALPHAAEVGRSPGWWGSLFLLTANAVFFGSLIFGYAFLFTIAPASVQPEVPRVVHGRHGIKAAIWMQDGPGVSPPVDRHGRQRSLR